MARAQFCVTVDEHADILKQKRINSFPFAVYAAAPMEHRLWIYKLEKALK